jgi:hypothetical protein
MVDFPTGYISMDTKDGLSTDIGRKRTAANSFTDKYVGFIYRVYVDNSYVSDISSLRYSSTGCQSGRDCAYCDTDATQDICLKDLVFDKETSSKDCPSSSCDGKSCVRKEEC